MDAIEKIRSHWFLILALVTMSGAWAVDHEKIKTLEDVVKEQSVIREEISEIKANSARMDERSKLILEMMQRQVIKEETVIYAPTKGK